MHSADGGSMIMMDTGQVTASGGKLSASGALLSSASVTGGVPGCGDDTHVDAAVSKFLGTWGRTYADIATSVSNLGATTSAIGVAVAADDQHRSGIFRVGKD